MTHGPREQRRWRGICAACACQMRQRPAGRRPASGQCLKHHIQLLTCKRVLPCESMGVAGEVRARVLRACRVRGGRVCWCASAEQARGRGGGEGQGRGESGARRGLTSLAICNFLLHRAERAARVYSSIVLSRSAGARSLRRRSCCCCGACCCGACCCGRRDAPTALQVPLRLGHPLFHHAKQPAQASGPRSGPRCSLQQPT